MWQESGRSDQLAAMVAKAGARVVVEAVMRLKDAYRDEWLFEFAQTGEDESGVDYRVSIKREDYRMQPRTWPPKAPHWFVTVWEIDIKTHRKVDEQDPDDVRVLLIKPALLEAATRMSSLIWTAAQKVSREHP